MKHPADNIFYITRRMLATKDNKPRIKAIKRICGGKPNKKIPITLKLLMELEREGSAGSMWLLGFGHRAGKFTKEEVDSYWSTIAQFVRDTEGQYSKDKKKWMERGLKVGARAFMDVLYNRAKRQGAIK